MNQAPLDLGNAQPIDVDSGRTTSHESGADAIHTQIRGSALLLAGKFISLGLNLVTQVLVVRYLSKLDFGAFAFALSLTETAAVFAGLGMDKAISRYAAMYHERGEQERMAAAIGLSCLVVLGLGLAIVAAAFGCQAFLQQVNAFSPLQVTLLLTLIVLTPAYALDNVLVTLAATFSGARLVFFRRVILAPGVKLGAVAVVILLQGDVRALAISYVVMGCLGVLLYGALLWRLFVGGDERRSLRFRVYNVPLREYFGFSLSIFGSDLTLLVRSALVVLMLELMHSTSSVAEYRAVLPIARLSELVIVSFSFLYIPIASRMFAKDRGAELNNLYWQTASWIAVLTFPFFAASYALAKPLTSFLFGSQYAQSGIVLATLAFGFYVNAALGFNSRTLKAIGKVRQVLAADLAALIVSVALYYFWIPRFGATGAALAACVSTIFHAAAKQAALYVWSSVRWCDRRHVRVYAGIAAATVALTLWYLFAPENLPLGLCFVAVCWLGVLAASREALVIGEVFPELRRKVPFASYDTSR